MSKGKLLLIILYSAYASGQTTEYLKSYNLKTISNFGHLSTMVLAFDSSYAIACTDSTYKFLELINLSSSGHLNWRQTFQTPNQVYNVKMVQTPDSGFIITASTGYPPDATTKIAFIKTDKNGNKQSVRLIGDSLTSQSNSELQIRDSDVFILSFGSIKLGGNNYEHDYFVIRTDLTGNINWFKKYNWKINPFIPYTYSMVVTKDEEIYVAGSIWNSSNSYLSLSKIDSLGNLIWSKFYTPLGDVEPLKMIMDRNGNLILTGRSALINLSGWDIFLSKIDSTGQFKWLRTFGPGLEGNWNEGYFVFQNNTGYMICAEPENFGDKSRAALMQTDTTGNLQWMKIYGDTTGSFPNGAVQLNNGYAIYGIKGTYSSIAAMYLMRTDTNGITSCKWTSVTLPDSSFTFTSTDTGMSATMHGELTYDYTEQTNSLTENNDCGDENAIIYYSPNEFELYPNPFHSSITISNENNRQLYISVYNLLGEVVYLKEFKQNNVTSIDLSALANGMYIIKIMMEERQITRKIVKM